MNDLPLLRPVCLCGAFNSPFRPFLRRDDQDEIQIVALYLLAHQHLDWAGGTGFSPLVPSTRVSSAGALAMPSDWHTCEDARHGTPPSRGGRHDETM